MRIATLCGMGFGTSMMLKLFIEEILKDIGMKAEVVPWDLGTFKGQQADVVVAPTDMDMHLRGTSANVVLIKNLVDKKELRDKLVPVLEEHRVS
ncbi:MAG: PTS sugar transporter subunit IIB [Chloroflexi bacterium]|nr:PTS sugar transporter subunit IIB [Chloroflexota bacterium]